MSVCNCTGHNYARTTRHLSVGVARQLNYASRVDCIHGRMSCNTSRASLNRKSAGLAASTMVGRRAYEQEVASSACRAQLWASCSHPCVSTRRQTEYYREPHGDGNSGNTADTAVTPPGKGTVFTIIPCGRGQVSRQVVHTHVSRRRQSSLLN